jgi:hypothetical protein
MALATRTKAFAARAVAPAAPARALRMVVRASAQKQQQPAARSFELPSAVRPVLATVVANAIMALPSLADSGKVRRLSIWRVRRGE